MWFVDVSGPSSSSGSLTPKKGGTGTGTGLVQIQRAIAAHTDEVTHLAFTPDGTEIVSAAKDGTMRAMSALSGRTLRRVDVEDEWIQPGHGPTM